MQILTMLMLRRTLGGLFPVRKKPSQRKVLYVPIGVQPSRADCDADANDVDAPTNPGVLFPERKKPSRRKVCTSQSGYSPSG
ncbi:hypothetical protein VK70_16210 [Paenibacillus durus ATCC 35681]|uniref:Uncharacterized protein n=1 Tax=Paenibacillus durus ATCC 35681 TaxID=1333534 RepID=A0A0F7FC41_PAEDU|nr:hypothetical protein VK70_16210 [Paenibacillus durus ATCC 35681]